MFRRHAQPLMRKRVDRISGGDLHSMLLPVWKAKRATAKHLVMRVGMVMRWAIAQEYRVDNPASGAVVQALPRGGATVTNLKALPYGDVPGAIKALRETTASRSSKLAMELLILTATRGNEVRMAPWVGDRH